MRHSIIENTTSEQASVLLAGLSSASYHLIWVLQEAKPSKKWMAKNLLLTENFAFVNSLYFA